MVPPEGDEPRTGMDLDGATAEPGRTVVVLDPVSGDDTHGPQVRSLAEQHGYGVRETGGDGIDIARQTAADADRVVACGGDGTISHVVRGLWQADALADVQFGVVPGGTGNDFAENVGIGGIADAFDILERGRVRRLDVGTVAVDGGTPIPFLNACVCGLTADASAETTPEQKQRYGVLAYAANSLRRLAAFDALDLCPIEGGDGWSGKAALVLFGNARGFPGEDGPAADIEDGLLDVTVIEDRPATDPVGGGALFELFDRDPDSLLRLRTGHAEVVVENDESTAFSLDGEMVSARSSTVEARQTALGTVVGPACVAHPE
jgi:YegS/Rv2252/BmrU family lipid kinase